MQILNRKISKSPQEHLDESDKWYDGFSTFYVGEDGRIAKHVADKVKIRPGINPFWNF